MNTSPEHQYGDRRADNIKLAFYCAKVIVLAASFVCAVVFLLRLAPPLNFDQIGLIVSVSVFAIAVFFWTQT